MPPNLTPGQKLWMVQNHGPDREITIGKIGRRWATLVDEGARRLEITTMRVFRGNSITGRAVLSRDDLLHELEIKAAWRFFRDKISRVAMPADMTLSRITEAARLLGVE